MLKEVVIALDIMHEWSIKYSGAPIVVPKKDWITIQNAKVQLRINIQSRDKLTKDVDWVLASYRYLFSSLESMIQIHLVPSIREVRQVRKHDDISKEV